MLISPHSQIYIIYFIYNRLYMFICDYDDIAMNTL